MISVYAFSLPVGECRNMSLLIRWFKIEASADEFARSPSAYQFVSRRYAFLLDGVGIQAVVNELSLALMFPVILSITITTDAVLSSFGFFRINKCCFQILVADALGEDHRPYGAEKRVPVESGSEVTQPRDGAQAVL